MGRKKKHGRRTTHGPARVHARRELRLRWWLALGGVLMLGLVVLLVALNQPAPAAPVETTGAPRLKVDREKVDLGEVRLGEWVSASFEISNVGDQKLGFVEVPYVEVVEGC